MNTITRIMLLFLLGTTLLVHSIAAQPNTFDLADNQQEQLLSRNLTQWHDLQTQKATLTKSFQSLDVRSYPERDERFWWNPFWQNSRQNQAQLANRLLLDIQMVDRDIKSLQQQLLDQTSAFAQAAIITASSLSKTQIALWEKSDHWRLPIILLEPDWKSFSVAKLKPLSPELYKKRVQALLSKQSEWIALQNYLNKKTQLFPEASNEKKQVQLWIKKVEAQLNTITELINNLEVYPQTPVNNNVMKDN